MKPQTKNLKPKTAFIFENTPAIIRQTPEMCKEFLTLFKDNFGYTPSCPCSFFSDLQKLKEKLKSQTNH